MSKYFQVPHAAAMIKPWKTILDIDPEAKPEPMSFLRFATMIWLNDPRAITEEGKTTQSVLRIRKWSKVIDAFEAAKPGDWITMSDEDFEVLKRIVEHPQHAFQMNNMATMLACMPFVDAVLAAKDELPAVVNGASATTANA
jgi:hypothetical protein